MGDDVEPGVRRILDRMASAALAKCGRLGIPAMTFYETLLHVQARNRGVSVMALLRKTFEQLEATRDE